MTVIPILLCLAFSVCQAVISSQFSGPGRLTGTAFGIPGRDATFDYVVVGGGIAGSVVASRLTQHSDASVALIEAGSFYEINNGNRSQIPFFAEQWDSDDTGDWQPLTDWGLETVPQINGKVMHYAQGKSLGGGSGKNQLQFQRGTKGSYQLWADEVGDQSYTWDAMTPFFKRSPHFSTNEAKRPANAKPLYNSSVFSPSGGPLHVSYPAYVYPLSLTGPKAFSSIGMSEIPGFTTGILNGWGYWQFTLSPSTGLRSSSESSFLSEALGRPGLTTYLNSMARKVIFENGTAKSVKVTNFGLKPFKVSARKEIIISAGAYHSPQLLMVSGIGPRDTLAKCDIPVVSNLRGVGQDMWDSCSIGGPTYETNVTSYSRWKDPVRMAEAVDLLLSNGSGPLTNIGLDIGAWEKLPAAYRANLSESSKQALDKFPSDWPEIEYSFDSQVSTLTPMYTRRNFGTIGVILVATTSRGNMTIRSASNLDPPIINPNWLEDKTDQELAVQAYKRARLAWKAIPDKVGEEYYPGPHVVSDEQLLTTIKKNIGAIHHSTAACKMGRANDSMAVVDSKGRVFGVKNLRVIDSSSLPFTPPGHIQGTVYAYAEKLTQNILDGMS